jgi:hypothetical protein
MSRVINTDSAGKKRTQHMRTGAELLRHLSQKTSIDEGIDSSAQAWEKRDYWMKAEEFRQRWHWTGDLADELQSMVFADEWHRLPEMMVRLLPYFSDIKINKFMRKSSMWSGSYDRLMREKPPAR